MKTLLFAIAIAAIALDGRAQTRLASDFEIERMRQRIASSSDFLSQLSARLNLGDLYRSRADAAGATAEYERAFAAAQAERLKTRRASDLSGYATATAYAALSAAKLGRGAQAFDLLEESLRFASDSPKTWNLYSSAMTILKRTAKSIAAARNAVALAEREAAESPAVARSLDLAIYRYTLASALFGSGATADREAETILRRVVDDLESERFADLRREIARAESFEIYSTARGEADAYLSIRNRAGLRLAALLEKRDPAAARAAYERVLEHRTDDPTALAALARLRPVDERAQSFAAAFDANPFSLSLIRSYREFLRTNDPPPAESSSAGGRVRRVVETLHRGERRAAREALDALDREFPDNETLRTLRRDLDRAPAAPAFFAGSARLVDPTPQDLDALLALLSNDRATPQQRAALDEITFRSVAIFDRANTSDGRTIIESGSIGALRFRFGVPTAFNGTFLAATPYVLLYRALGVTEVEGVDVLLIEPAGIEASR